MDEHCALAGVGNGHRAIVRLGGERGQRLRRIGPADAWAESGRPLKSRCVGKISSPGSDVLTSTTIMCPLSGVPFFGVVGERGLVAVVAVGDQQLPVGEELGTACVDAPETCSLGLEVGLAVGRERAALAVVEEEDRLDLRPRRAQQSQAALLRPGVRALVREDARVSYGSTCSDATMPSRRRATPSGPT